MKKLLFLILIFISAFHDGSCGTGKNVAEPIDPELTAKIDDFITNVYLPNAGITGLGISIVRTDNGQAVYSNGFGMADQEKGIPNGNQTQFLIASITKSLTSTVVVKILNEKFPELGESVLDTPIRKLVPAANFTLIDRFRSEHGTFRDLLSHRMCFQSDDLQLVAEPFDTTEEIVYRQRYAEEVCGIRGGFQYNNQMYVVAGELIGILANRPYVSLVQDLLTEIGMLNSSLGTKSDDYSNLPFRTRPYYVMDSVSHPMNTDLLKRVIDSNAAGGLWSTPDDMAKYLSFHLNLGKVEDKQVIPESVMKWLRAPSNSVPISYFKSSDDDIIVNILAYGLGLIRSSYDGWEYLEHSGSLPPYNSFLSLFPSQNLGIFTSSNQSPVLLDQLILHSFIFETLHGSGQNVPKKINKFIELEKAKQAEIKRRKAKTLGSFLGKISTHKRRVHIPSEIAGNYGSGSSGDIEIYEKFNPETNLTGLYLSYGKWARGWLESYEHVYDSGNNGEGLRDITNFKIIWDTDIIQESYAVGDTVGLAYARFYNDTFEFVGPGADEMISYGKFRVGVSLENLPPIPWDPQSC